MIFDKEDFESFDPELWAAIHAEEIRQQQNIELIASENIVSKAVMAAQGSVLTNKYAEGYQENVTMVVQKRLMLWKIWQLTVQKNFSVQNLSMFNLTQVLKPMLQPIWH